MTYTLIDGVVLFILLISTLLAWTRGFVREGMSIIGWLIALFVAAQFAAPIVPMIEELPFIETYLAGNCVLLTVMAFVVVFVIAMVVMALITPLFANFIQGSALSAFDSGLGALFGFLRGVVIVILMAIIYDAFIQPSTPIAMVDDSRSYAIFADPKESVVENLPDQEVAPNWLNRQFNNVIGHCEGDAPDV